MAHHPVYESFTHFPLWGGVARAKLRSGCDSPANGSVPLSPASLNRPPRMTA